MRNYFAIIVLFLSTLCIGAVRPESVIGKVHNPRTPFTSERLGTAWCLTPDCDLMITNHHVLQFIGHKLAINGERVGASWSATGPNDQNARFVPSYTESYKYTQVRDLAILRMKKPMSRRGMHGVRIYAGELRGGEPVTIMSYPAGKLTVTTGHFDSMVEDGILKFDLASPLAAGCSGGLILNERDEAVGVLFALQPSRMSAYAVPIWSLADFIKKVQPQAYADLFLGEVFRPNIHGRLLLRAETANTEMNLDLGEEAASGLSPNFMAAAIGGLNPIAVLPAMFLRSAITVPPLPEEHRSTELQSRPKESVEVQTLRQRAQAMVEQMANFLSLQTLTLADNTVWQHQVRVIDGQQVFTKPDGTNLMELPIPHLGVVPGSEWRDLPQMVGSNLRLPLRYIGERTENKQKMKVFQFNATEEDGVCAIRIKRGALSRTWKGSVPCRGEVWTDADFNILRITEEMTLPQKTGMERCTTVVLYGWLHGADASNHLVPSAIWLQAQGRNGRTVESTANFSSYHLFRAKARIMAN
jgi:hypothetical protein